MVTGVQTWLFHLCSTWEISKDWKWGEELKYVGSYIVDDRSTYPHEVGIMYWRQ